VKSLMRVLSTLVGIPTNEGVANHPYVHALSVLLGDLEPELVVNYESREARLSAAAWKIPAPNPTKVPLVFVIHSDTVNPQLDPTKASGYSWDFPPFAVTKKDDKLHGLGSTDMKGGTAALICALDQVDRNDLNRDIWVVMDGDEETDVRGGCELKKLLPLKEAEVVIIEPTAYGLRCRQKASITLLATVSGSAQHASQATKELNRTDNAIEQARRVLNALHAYELSLPDVGGDIFDQPTVAVTKIQGGTSINTIAEEVVITIDRRARLDEDLDEVIKAMGATVKAAVPDAKPYLDFKGEGYQTPSSDPFVLRSLALAREVVPDFALMDTPGWSEASNFCHLGPTIIAGPGVLDQLHKVDEYTSLKSLEAYVEIFKRWITA